MIVHRLTGRVKDLYFVSQIPRLQNEIITPEVPNNILTRGKYVNWQLPRVELYPSIGEALSGGYLGVNLSKGSEYFVYRALGIRNENLILPSLTDAPYNQLISEWWSLANLRCECLGKIRITGIKDKLIYHFGPRSTSAFLYVWNWEEVLQKWEK